MAKSNHQQQYTNAIMKHQRNQIVKQRSKTPHFQQYENTLEISIFFPDLE